MSSDREDATASRNSPRLSAEAAFREPPVCSLGERLVPIPFREKGPTVPRTEKRLRGPDDPVLHAYLDAGWDYAIAMHADLAALDAHGARVLLDGLPSVGKTTDLFAAIAETDEPIRFVTPRGHEE